MGVRTHQNKFLEHRREWRVPKRGEYRVLGASRGRFQGIHSRRGVCWRRMGAGEVNENWGASLSSTSQSWARPREGKRLPPRPQLVSGAANWRSSDVSFSETLLGAPLHVHVRHTCPSCTCALPTGRRLHGGSNAAGSLLRPSTWTRGAQNLPPERQRVHSPSVRARGQGVGSDLLPSSLQASLLTCPPSARCGARPSAKAQAQSLPPPASRPGPPPWGIFLVLSGDTH